MVYRFLLLFFLLILCAAYAQDSDIASNAVFLNLNDSEIINPFSNNAIKGKINYDYTDLKYTPSQNDINKLIYQDVHRIVPQKQTYSKSFEKDINSNTLLGTTYKTTSGSGKWEDSLSLYSKYKRDRFSFTSSYTPAKNGYRYTQNPGTVSFAPELKLNNHISLKNVYSDNLSSRQKKNEVVLSLKPFKDERMDLSVGAGQTFSTENLPSKSQLNFSTKFHF